MKREIISNTLAERLYRESFIKPDLEHDYQTGARIEYVSPKSLPDGVLGLYNPVTHSMLIANNLSAKETNFVHKHEQGHATGIIDEARTDAYAASQTGYNLRPFGSMYGERKAA